MSVNSAIDRSALLEAIEFYDRSPDGQYDRIAVQALRAQLIAQDFEHEKNAERYRELMQKVEEAEGRCCPEDYGFEEYIGVLKRQIAEMRKWTGLADYDAPSGGAIIDRDAFFAGTCREPKDDDLERCNCPHAGRMGHFMCGWNAMLEKPNFELDPAAVIAGRIDAEIVNSLIDTHPKEKS